MKKALVTIIGVLALVAAYLFAWPVRIAPEEWNPPVPDPGRWSPNRTLDHARRVELPDGFGPEDIEVDAVGRIYAGLDDGRILRWPGLGDPPELFADTEGRPLGLHWDPQGRLLIADAFAGLLRAEADGTIEVLATECSGRPLAFTDDLETLADGTVYFTDASVKFVLINETSRYRVLRYWLTDKRVEVLIDNLSGFPDGISSDGDGVYWVAIASREPPSSATASPPASSAWKSEPPRRP